VKLKNQKGQSTSDFEGFESCGELRSSRRGLGAEKTEQEQRRQGEQGQRRQGEQEQRR
jgi:hypothetical protein